MIYEKDEAVRLVIEAGHRLSEAGLVARTWGNISARISDTQFVITPSGMAYDRLTEDDIVTVNIADCSYEGAVKPSSEKGIHADAYRLRPDVDFVVHTHQLYATAWGVIGKPLRLRDALLGEIVPNAAYGISSTKKLRKNVAAAVEQYPGAKAVFMRGHGVLCLGADMEESFAISRRLEYLCREKVQSELSLEASEKEPVTVPEELQTAMGDTVLYFTDAPAVFAVSHRREDVFPVIDDMAQIAGTDYPVVTVMKDWEKKAARALKSRNVVFLRHRGALCSGADIEECKAVAAVTEKNCLSLLYGELYGSDVRLGAADALLQRSVYKLKYSKLK